VIGKLDFPDNHPMLDHFRFLKKQCEVAHVMPKMTIPSPAVLHFRGGRKSISKQVYPDLDVFFEDLAKTYRKAVKAFLRRRLPLSAVRRHGVGLSVLAGGTEESPRARRYPDGLQEIYARVINYAIAEAAGRHDHHHPCLPRQFPAPPGFRPAVTSRWRRPCWPAPNYDGYFLEYDSERAGGFEPLRFLPKGNKIVGGRLSSPPRAASSRKKERHQAAAGGSLEIRAGSSKLRWYPPQCGFASTEEGNLLTQGRAVGPSCGSGRCGRTRCGENNRRIPGDGEASNPEYQGFPMCNCHILKFAYFDATPE